MPIMFNSLLCEAGLDLGDVRLLRHKDNRANKGYSPYEMWRDNQPLFDDYQSTQLIKNRSKLNSNYWASFLGTPFNETMFIGIYKITNRQVLKYDKPIISRDGVDKAGTCDYYKLNLESNLSDLIGKLFIEWGTGAIAWIQRADNKHKPIIELRKEFKEPEFPGYLNFIKHLSELNKLPKSWVNSFQSVKGIYLLTCPKTKEQYVGSATGTEGFWGRWQDYVQTGHGGDIALKSRQLEDYQVTILEVAGSALAREDIIKMEELWKMKLQSKDMGLNR